MGAECSAPVYYLIGADGKLVASATEWSAIEAVVEEVVELESEENQRPKSPHRRSLQAKVCHDLTPDTPTLGSWT
jgi:hypothetical protein